MKQQILILGAGEIGRAIKKVLKKTNYQVDQWDKKPGLVPKQKDLEEVVAKADFIFLCIPSFAFFDALEVMKPLLSKKTIVVSLAKGIEQKSLQTTDELMNRMLPRGQKFALLSGSMLAEELLIGLSGFAVAASKSLTAATKVQRIFKDTDLYTEVSTDLHGVAISGVLKNVYVLALGMADELRLGANSRGWLIAQSVGEMQSILKSRGGKTETMLGIAGVADLVATGTSGFSSNHKFGRMIARHGKCDDVCEGAISLKPLLKLLGKKAKQYKVLMAIKSVVLNKQNAKKAFKQLVKEI